MSTLRRRIKGGEIEYKFADGKYLIKDSPLQHSSSGSEAIAPPTQMSQVQRDVQPTVERTTASAQPVATPPASNANQYWETTQALLAEIKKAYSLILQEKEEQILQLKEEVADLKTLVRVLEEENSRVGKQNTNPKFDLDLDLGLEA